MVATTWPACSAAIPHVCTSPCVREREYEGAKGAKRAGRASFFSMGRSLVSLCSAALRVRCAARRAAHMLPPASRKITHGAPID